ncbi:hypothetical protein [Massilibacterium senegalense]|uniref:hypothetical protein n=1 Tax=Massilibacterium senegalense TaxID=1632858 RepID=UPI0007815E29|nr:hypothetical protein [Massilibacterium senegalense]
MKRLIWPFLLILLLFSPHLYWLLKPVIPIEIAVVDKTVPKKDYREHSGLFWILKNEKIVKSDGELYDIGRDYFGYDPYDQKPLPPYQAKQPLDLIYIADTYGVYSNDLQEKPDGERSKHIYGGMDLLEWNAVMDSKEKQTTLIAEFNSFATPTDRIARDVMQQNLNIEWSGWTGRYFANLNSDEIPPWLIRNYESQYKKKWKFDGSGIAFVHISDKVVVLDESESDGFVSFELTNDGEKQYKNVSASKYMYWFDVVKPINGSVVEAEYKLLLTKEGKKELKDANIPTTFPAVIHHNENNTYYFAGDYADFPKQAFAKWQGSPLLFWVFANDDSAFYWRSYVPLMKEILDDIKEQKEG